MCSKYKAIWSYRPRLHVINSRKTAHTEEKLQDNVNMLYLSSFSTKAEPLGYMHGFRAISHWELAHISMEDLQSKAREKLCVTYTVSLLENFCFTFSSGQALIRLDGDSYQWRPVNPRFTNFTVDIIQKTLQLST